MNKLKSIAKGVIIAIGGREDKGKEDDKKSFQVRNEGFIKMEILKIFCEELKSKKALIAVIPTATSEPKESGEDYIKAFGKLGFHNVKVIDIRDRNDTTKVEFLDLAKKADGFIFTGGNQLR